MGNFPEVSGVCSGHIPICSLPKCLEGGKNKHGAASFRESFRLALTALGVVRMTVRYAVCLKKNGVEPKYYRWFDG